MGTAHSVVAHLLQQPDFAFLRFGVTTGTQNAVVVVDTGTEQDDPLAVEQKSVIAPGKGPHTECRLGAVIAKHGSAAVECRGIGAPKFGIGDLHPQNSFAVGFCLRRGHGLLTIQDGNRHRAAGRCLHGHFHLCGVNAQRADLHTIGQDVPCGGSPQGDRAVDSRAGIPAGVRLIRIVGNNF